MQADPEQDLECHNKYWMTEENLMYTIPDPWQNHNITTKRHIENDSQFYEQ